MNRQVAIHRRDRHRSDHEHDGPEFFDSSGPDPKSRKVAQGQKDKTQEEIHSRNAGNEIEYFDISGPVAKCRRLEEALTKEQLERIEVNKAQARQRRAEREGVPAQPEKFSLNIDDSDGDYHSEASWQDERSEVDGSEVPVTFKPPMRKRLSTKTPAAQALGYPLRALMKAHEFKVRKAQLKEIKRKRNQEWKAARLAAVNLLSQQADLSNVFPDFEDRSWSCQLPHASHRITSLHGDGDTIYCKLCGLWSKRSKLKGLARPCHGILNGNCGHLRLLECGVMPAPGARIPPRFRRKRRRKGRW